MSQRLSLRLYLSPELVKFLLIKRASIFRRNGDCLLVGFNCLLNFVLTCIQIAHLGEETRLDARGDGGVNRSLIFGLRFLLITLQEGNRSQVTMRQRGLFGNT